MLCHNLLISNDNSGQKYTGRTERGMGKVRVKRRVVASRVFVWQIKNFCRHAKRKNTLTGAVSKK